MKQSYFFNYIIIYLKLSQFVILNGKSYFSRKKFYRKKSASLSAQLWTEKVKRIKKLDETNSRTN